MLRSQIVKQLSTVEVTLFAGSEIDPDRLAHSEINGRGEDRQDRCEARATCHGQHRPGVERAQMRRTARPFDLDAIADLKSVDDL